MDSSGNLYIADTQNCTESGRWIPWAPSPPFAGTGDEKLWTETGARRPRQVLDSPSWSDGGQFGQPLHCRYPKPPNPEGGYLREPSPPLPGTGASGYQRGRRSRLTGAHAKHFPKGYGGGQFRATSTLPIPVITSESGRWIPPGPSPPLREPERAATAGTICQATGAMLHNPVGVTVDGSGNVLHF